MGRSQVKGGFCKHLPRRHQATRNAFTMLLLPELSGDILFGANIHR
jgi:hypothetical protein